MNHKEICLACLPIVRQVAAFIKSQVGEVSQNQIETKDQNSLVSYVDKNAETMLVTALTELVPEAGFITEENTVEQGGGDTLWIIDPLDGTNNFLHSIPHFSVSVALQYEGELTVGIVMDVMSDETFYAWKGGGAFLNGAKIQVSNTETLSNSVIATGFPYKVHDVAPLIRSLGYFMRYARGLRRMGSAALDIVYVACGRFDLYYETTLNIWDIAGGIVILNEAGGQVSDFENKNDYLYGGKLICSNRLVHQEAQQVILKNWF